MRVSALSTQRKRYGFSKCCASEAKPGGGVSASVRFFLDDICCWRSLKDVQLHYKIAGFRHILFQTYSDDLIRQAWTAPEPPRQSFSTINGRSIEVGLLSRTTGSRLTWTMMWGASIYARLRLGSWGKNFLCGFCQRSRSFASGS